MTNLTKAHRELFRRSADERFETLPELLRHCRDQQGISRDNWQYPQTFLPHVDSESVQIRLGEEGSVNLNHWSFSQLCTLCGVSRDTLNRLSPATAAQALQETLPTGRKPLQVLSSGSTVRSIHGVAYSRLWNADLVGMLADNAGGFQPPPKGFNGATGLYCGEQDLFCFLIDPAGWTDIGGQAFAPGFFVWNSEVGKRSLGIQTFWFQSVCQNHIVWDAVETVEFARKHTGNVAASLDEIRRILDQLVAKRDARTDGFAKLIRQAMQTKIGDDSEEATKALLKHGLTRDLVRKAVASVAAAGNPFTLWTMVDALTQLNGQIVFAGDRSEADQKVAKLLELAV